MEFSELEDETVDIAMTGRECGVIGQCLNEVCNGLGIRDFEARMRTTRHQADRLLDRFLELLPPRTPDSATSASPYVSSFLRLQSPAIQDDAAHHLRVTWEEAEIVVRAMAVTLGGDMLYTEYFNRIGAQPSEAADLILAIQKSHLRHRRRRRGKS